MKRMKMQIVIEIPEEAKQAFDCAESNDLKGCYYDHGGIIGNAIKNGTPLPEHHGRLIDVNVLYELFRGRCAGRCDVCALWTVEGCQHLKEAPTIIPATKEGE